MGFYGLVVGIASVAALVLVNQASVGMLLQQGMASSAGAYSLGLETGAFAAAFLHAENAQPQSQATMLESINFTAHADSLLYMRSGCTVMVMARGIASAYAIGQIGCAEQ